MHARSLQRFAAFPVLSLVLTMTGCGDHSELATNPSLAHENRVAAPQAAAAGESQPGFYPLAIGNRWTYQRVSIARLVPDEGIPPEPQTQESRFTREIAAAAEISGLQYLIDRGTGPGGIPLNDVDYRQDATGLYELSVSVVPPPVTDLSPTARHLCAAVRTPAARTAFEQAARQIEARIATVHAALRGMSAPADLSLPPTLKPWEITRLRYPLAPKLRWLIRNDAQFQFSAEVIRQEALDLAPGHLNGYRIRIAREILGPAEYAYVWYGPSGYLQLVGHFEVDAVDNTGNRIGRFVIDEREALIELKLVSPSPITGLPNRTGRPK